MSILEVCDTLNRRIQAGCSADKQMALLAPTLDIPTGYELVVDSVTFENDDSPVQLVIREKRKLT